MLLTKKIKEETVMNNSNKLSEFDHYFPEEFIDLYIDGELFLEAYSKKQEHRVEKFLKENNFKEDPSKTTDEEKRKGYRRGTIETDITDENGGKKRVPFELTPHPGENAFVRSYNKITGEQSAGGIRMSKQTVARKPQLANFVFKHEEGHAAVFFDKNKQKYGIELNTIGNEIMKFCKEYDSKLYHIFNRHDANPEEIFADRYAAKHSKYGGSRFKLEGTDQMVENVFFVNEELSRAAKTIKDIEREYINKDGSINELKRYNDIDKRLSQLDAKFNKITNKIGDIKHKIELNNMKFNHINERMTRSFTDIPDYEKSTKDLLDSLSWYKKYMEKLSHDVMDTYIIKHVNGEEVDKTTSEKIMLKIFNKYNESVFKTYKAFNKSSPDDEFFSKRFESYAKDMHDMKSHMGSITRLINESKLRINELSKSIINDNKNLEKIANANEEYLTAINKLQNKLKDLRDSIEILLELKDKALNDAGTKEQYKKTFDYLNDQMNRGLKHSVSTMARAMMTLAPEKRDELVKLDKDQGGSFAEDNIRGVKFYNLKNIKE